MGLDMYLYKELYVKNWPHMGPLEVTYITATRNDKALDTDHVVYLVSEVGYWRKANQIHSWLVKHIQDGQDNCARYLISIEQLEELLTTVERVLADHSLAEALLPTLEGFFFGGTDYDDYYFSDLVRTKGILEQLLADPEHNEAEYYYHSSW